jgi:MoxR-like ATPase
VSRRHALLRVRDGRVEVEDLSSKNGTFVNGERVRTTSVRVGDELRFGSVALVLEEVASGDADLAVRLETPPPEGGGAATTQGETAKVDRVDGTWLSAIEKAAQCLPRPVCKAGPALRALIGATGLAGGALVEWDGAGEPVVHTACGDPAVLEVVGRTRGLFREVARTGTAEARCLPGSSGVMAAAVPGKEQPMGVVVTGVSLPPGGELALRATAWLLAGSMGLAPCDGEGRAMPSLVFPDGHVPGESPAMVALYRQLRPLVEGDLPLLLVGETGAGKEHVARLIHASSRRSGGPFVALNCAAIPAELLEAELFGIERGVATGVEARIGKFELANGGTLFLDEVGDLTAALQAKLLRVVQEREVERVGGRQRIRVDVRLVTATNRDLEAMMAAGSFRDDLYYRLRVVELTLPPLRDRREDVPLLARHFVRLHSRRLGRSDMALSRAALELLLQHDFPGNVRELENVLEAAVALASGARIEADDIRLAAGARQAHRPPSDGPLDDVVRSHVLGVLARCGGNRAVAARTLGIDRSTLYRMLMRWNATGDAFRNVHARPAFSNAKHGRSAS